MERKNRNLRPSDRMLGIFLNQDFEHGIASGDEKLLEVLGSSVARLPLTERELLIAGVVKSLSRRVLPDKDVFLSRIHLLSVTPVSDIDESDLNRLRNGVVEVLSPAPKIVKEKLKSIYLPVLSDPRLDSVQDRIKSSPVKGRSMEDFDPDSTKKEIVALFWDRLMNKFLREDGTSNRIEISRRLGIRPTSMTQNVNLGFLPREAAFQQLCDTLDPNSVKELRVLYNRAQNLKQPKSDRNE